MTVIPINDQEKTEIKWLHESFEQKFTLTGFSVAAAAFLITGALIVITCGCLCLMLPGVNVVQDVVLRAVVPGLCALVASIPFIILSVVHARDQNLLREQQMSRAFFILDKYEIPEQSMEDQVDFVLHHLLNWPKNETPKNESEERIDKNKSWTIEYQKTFLTELKGKMGKQEDLNPRQKKLSEALEESLIRLTQKEKK